MPRLAKIRIQPIAFGVALEPLICCEIIERARLRVRATVRDPKIQIKCVACDVLASPLRDPIPGTRAVLCTSLRSEICLTCRASIRRRQREVIFVESGSQSVCAQGLVCPQRIWRQIEDPLTWHRCFTISIHTNQTVLSRIYTIGDGNPSRGLAKPASIRIQEVVITDVSAIAVAGVRDHRLDCLRPLRPRFPAAAAPLGLVNGTFSHSKNRANCCEYPDSDRRLQCYSDATDGRNEEDQCAFDNKQ
jgi:hypothetical protein